MDRYLESYIKKDLKEKVVILSGPRQVGKTTLSRYLVPSFMYLSYDFGNPVQSPFMLFAFKVNPDKQKEIPAVTHVDGTARPQTVSREVNPLYWKLIS